MVWDIECEDFSDTLSACNFSQGALNVFKVLGLTERDKPVYSSTSALAFAYNNLPSDLVLTSDERQTLALLAQMAHLFDITDFDDADVYVCFFAVDLGIYNSSRSLNQYAVHSIIARTAPYCSVVIFRNGDAVSLSVAFCKASIVKSIFLSDWFELSSVKINEFFLSIGMATLSSDNAIFFVNDLVYLIARDYYIRPLSSEYLRFEMNTDEDFLGQIMLQYGDDYVSDDSVEILNGSAYLADEIDFDIIEYELEQMDLVEYEDGDDNGLDDEYKQSAVFDGDKSSIAQEIPKEALADPVLLLKWLDDNSADEAFEVDNLDAEIVEMITAKGLDYIDNRSKGGRLWIFGGYELAEFVERCRACGFDFHFKEGGGKATNGFDAWWH